MPEAVFFDLDGTLADTHAPHLATRPEVPRLDGVEASWNLYGEKTLAWPKNEEVVREPLPSLSDEEARDLLAPRSTARRRLSRSPPSGRTVWLPTRSFVCAVFANGKEMIGRQDHDTRKAWRNKVGGGGFGLGRRGAGRPRH